MPDTISQICMEIGDGDSGVETGMVVLLIKNGDQRVWSDYRRKTFLISVLSEPLSIQGVSVDIVDDYKYLGVNTDNRLDWAKNTETLYRNCQSCLYFLR